MEKTMRAYFRSLLDACKALALAIVDLSNTVVEYHRFQSTHGNLEARVEELERQRALFEAEVTGELLKAEAEYRKAANAEGRAKTAANKIDDVSEDRLESDEEFAQRYRAYLQDRDAEGGATEEVPDLLGPLVGTRSIREQLKARKWARG